MANLSTQTKYLLGCGTLAIVATFGFIVFAAWSIYRGITEAESNFEKELPEEIRNASILKGRDFFAKSEFFKLEKPSFFKAISRGGNPSEDKEQTKRLEFENGKGNFSFSDMKICGDEIVAVAQNGGYVFDKSGKLNREIMFEPTEQTVKVWWWTQRIYRGTTNNLRIVDLENDGKCEFTSYNSMDGFAVFDSNGNGLWRYGQRMKEIDLQKIWNEREQNKDNKESYVTNAETMDFDGDGISEFLISESEKGIRLLDKDRQEKWFKEDEYPTADMYLVDADGDGKTDLFEFQGQSSQIRDPRDGNVLKTLEIDGWNKEMLPIDSESKIKGVRFVSIDNNRAQITDINNKILIDYEAPLSEIKSRTKLSSERKNPRMQIAGQIDANSTKAEPRKKSRPIANSNSERPIGPAPRIETAPAEYREEEMKSAPKGDFKIDDSDEAENELVNRPKFAWLRLKKDKPKYLAVVLSFMGIPRSNLYVYEPNGELIYHELLSEEADSILLLPNSSGIDSFLIGGKQTIWKFETKTDNLHK